MIAAIAALSGILSGYDTGVISGAILLGALLGAIFSGRLADHIGRKRLLIVDAIIFIAGTLATAISTTIIWLIAGCIVVDFAIGIASI